MSKRRAQDSQRQGKRPRPAIKKHLYLVLDDWERGYSIRQIDPDTMLSVSDTDDLACTNRDPTHLPEPAAFRFVAPALDTQFIAMGSNIVVVSSSVGAEAPTLVYDTGAAALAIGPPLPGLLSDLLVATAGGDAVYALTTLGAGLPLAFEAFSWAPRTGEAAEPGRPTHGWSWKSVAAPPPPFAPEAIVSYAVHPDGRTVFVSTATRAAHGSRRGTHSFDTTRREWRCHGDWVLPFHGQGFFDRELDAWVGLDEEQGCVCACQVASRSTISIVPPESDRMEEKLFCATGESTRSRTWATASFASWRACLGPERRMLGSGTIASFV
ncbi:unnamed protein product [Miscanthus lutarioriparius]|uniref:Uncharacterized protein n=1 Tax=Miscanthus lutarioriparius TaxID=422564 RepID=A0A811PXH1_9POAL|nr:unnamed protein product [Miscanthus lutarioriparius]